MKRIAWVLAALLAPAPAAGQQTYDLQGQAIYTPDPIETLEDDRRLGGPPVPNQSYLVKQMQTTVAACMGGLIYELTGEGAWEPGIWTKPHDAFHSTSDWRVNNQRFVFRAGGTAIFSNARWDPEHSRVDYGDPKVAHDALVENDAKTKVIRNSTSDTVDVAYDESEELTNSFSTSVTHGVTLDMTVSTETTVSGTYMGVSAEEKVTAEFGVSTTSEESREESEEGTTSESIHIEFTALPRENYLVKITKEHETEYQPFDIDGVMDFDITLELSDRGGRLGRHNPGGTVGPFQGIQGFEQFVYGFDTRYPEMAGFYDASYSRTKNGINCALAAGNRTLTVSGTNQASLEKNADYSVSSLGSDIPDHLKHLPVEDACDLGDCD